MQKKPYQTAGREALADFLSGNPDRQFSVSELCLSVNGDSSRGKSSIYRRLDELCRSGEVLRTQSEHGRESLYRYIGSRCNCADHFHETCTVCGAIRHLTCADADDFAAHLLEMHGFSVDRRLSVLYGICADCRSAARGDAT